MNKPLDVTKPVMMKGQPNIDLKYVGQFEDCLVFAYRTVYGKPLTISRSLDGVSLANDDYSIVNRPERKEYFCNIYKNAMGAFHTTEYIARSHNNGGTSRGMVKVIFEDEKVVGVELLKE
jgi:hypothetical protein